MAWSLRILFLVALFTVAAPGAIFAEETVWPDCTVEMVDGTVYEHVDVTWKLDGFMLGLRTAGREEINLSPRDVARIHDADGRHITEEVADASPADTHFALLGRRRVEPTGLGLAADLGGSLSFTSGFGGFTTAGAVFVGVRQGLSHRVHLRLQYRRQGVREYVPELADPLSVHTHEIALLAGYRPVHPRRNRNYSYLEAGPVLVAWDRRWNGNAGSTVDGGDPAVGFLLRAGVLLRFSDHLGLDLGGFASVRPSVAVDADDTGVVIGLNLAVAVY